MKANRRITLLLAQSRKEKGLSQDVLAKKVGVSRGQIINYEKGLSIPTLDITLQLMDVLDCSINSLVMVQERDEYLFMEGMRLHLTENVNKFYKVVAEHLGIVSTDQNESQYEALENHYSNGFENGATLTTDIQDIVVCKRNNLNLEPVFEESYKEFYAVRNVIKDVISECFKLTDEEKKGMLVSCLNQNEIVIERNYLIGAESKGCTDAFVRWANQTYYGKRVKRIY